MKLLIKNGRVLNPANGFDGTADVLVCDGIIKKVGKDIASDDAKVIDATGLFVMPGFIDLHTHMRDPGQTHKETVETCANAAAAGGYTTIVGMPNTSPVVDNVETLSYVLDKGKACDIRICQVGSITMGMKGEELSDLPAMKKAGAIAFSEDGKSVMSAGLCRNAMQKLKELDMPFLDHCEDNSISPGGVFNDDPDAAKFGVKLIPNITENAIAFRDILIAKDTGAKLHLCHCSTKEIAELLIRLQKEGGFENITAEICPHHFSMTSADIKDGEGLTNYKMNPPLRTKEDVDALKEALKTGAIGVISTDHAPHSFEEKQKPLPEAPFGITGLETAAALTYTHLVKEGVLTPLQMAERMSFNPAKVINVPYGTLNEGAAADIVLFDPGKEHVIDKKDFKSKSFNTPFIGEKVTGMVVKTISGGKVVFER